MAHLDLMKTHKRTYAAAGALELAARPGLSRDQRLLVQLRASFLNGCRYCIGMHSKEALDAGHDQAWIDGIRDWTDGTDSTDSTDGTVGAVGFSDDDALILAFTTAGTRLVDGFDPTLRERVTARFGEKTTGSLISAVAAINTWNRLGVLSGK